MEQKYCSWNLNETCFVDKGMKKGKIPLASRSGGTGRRATFRA